MEQKLRKFHSEVYRLIKSIWKKEVLLEGWKESFVVSIDQNRYKYFVAIEDAEENIWAQVR